MLVDVEIYLPENKYKHSPTEVYMYIHIMLVDVEIHLPANKYKHSPPEV